MDTGAEIRGETSNSAPTYIAVDIAFDCNSRVREFEPHSGPINFVDIDF